MNCKQSIPKHLRYTINDFNEQFPDDAACLEHLKEQRFPGGVTYCSKCKQDRKHYRINGRPVYSCDHCGTQVSPMAGTIFEHSSTSLRLWYYAMYLMASTRCGISAKQVQRVGQNACSSALCHRRRHFNNNASCTAFGGTGLRSSLRTGFFNRLAA